MSVLSSSTSNTSKSSISLTPRVERFETPIVQRSSDEDLSNDLSDKSQRDYDTFKHSIFQRLTFKEHLQEQYITENKNVIRESSFINHIINPDDITNLVIQNNLNLNKELKKMKKKLGDMILTNKVLDDENKRLSDEFTMMKLEQSLK
ncbi:hypothetical protein ACO0SA_001296 [Hanseniaspora valbyensis]